MSGKAVGCSSSAAACGGTGAVMLQGWTVPREGGGRARGTS